MDQKSIKQTISLIDRSVWLTEMKLNASIRCFPGDALIAELQSHKYWLCKQKEMLHA